MRRSRTFSRVFLKGHPRAGEPTYFVEKIWTSLDIEVNYRLICDLNPDVPIEILWDFWKSIILDKDVEPKHHTIRAGHHFKAGDWISPRVWSGAPYKSKQIIIAPDIEVKKVWDFSATVMSDKVRFSMPNIDKIAQNDGLDLVDFMQWFNKPFDGQIICWND